MRDELHRVVARWDGRQWMVRVEDADGFHIGQTTTRRLHQVEDNAERVITTELQRNGVVEGPVEFVVDVQLHPDVEEGFRLAEDLVADASREVQAAVGALQAAGMAAQDIAMLVAVRELTAGPRRALVAPNAEIAGVALDCRPDAIAVCWEDAGFGVTTYCRDCIEDDRSLWRDLPHGMSALVYEGPVRCDGCDRDITDLTSEDDAI